jgi:UDP-N-acetylmuramoyl-tripeptide--D-alanyl-D-alanine ligase
VIVLTVDEIAAVVAGEVTGAGDVQVATVTTDSREVGERALFVALAGESADGHDHAGGAVEAGAVAVLAERELGLDVPTVVVSDTWAAIAALGGHVRDRVDPLVVAITGSVGKTTTKDLTAAALSAGRETQAAEASFNNELGVPLTLLRTAPSTEVLVVEIGSRGRGHIARLTPLVRPDIAIVTAVAEVHLELFGDIETVAVAKGELVEALGPDGTAVLNGDDARVRAMASRTTAASLTYGIEGDHDLTARDIRLDRVARASFTAVTPWGEAEVRLPVAGRHQVGNALAALAAAGVAGVDLAAAAGALADAGVSSWRGEVHEAGGVVVLNDAYNANPTSVAAAVRMLQHVERTGETWAVLGVMAEIGPGHDAEHEGTGRDAVEAGVDHVVAVGGEAAAMAVGARAAGGRDVHEVADAGRAAALLRDRVRTGDVVLVKASRVGGLEAVADDLLAHLRTSGGTA